MTDKLQAYDLDIVTFTQLLCQTLQFYLVTVFVIFSGRKIGVTFSTCKSMPGFDAAKLISRKGLTYLFHHGK